MTQALFTSMTGMNAGTEQLTVVSDNVANMNTTAYKTSRVDFQDIWYQTQTTGTNSTKVMGGTNPYQVGVGVQTSAITKNFTASTTNTTGRTEDMALTGNGWFTVMNSDGEVLFTRDGTFSLDENGYLCTANGCKVLGMSQMESLASSTTPIRIPTAIKVVENGTEAGKLGNMKPTELNGLGATYADVGITSGKFTVVVVENGVKTPMTIDLGDTTAQTMEQIRANIQAQSGGKFNVSFQDGAMSFQIAPGVTELQFESIPEKDGGSNFVEVTQIGSASNLNGAFNSRVLNYTATISQVDNVTADTTHLYKSFSVGKDGLISVTYGDGSILSIKANDDGSTYFTYQDPSGIIIDGNTANSDDASLYVDPNVTTKSSMQMQFAKVTNDSGLVAQGNNMYTAGPNAGQVVYTAANTNGVGAVVTGALESSNVDLAQQFSNMILAQRLVQANSQVFSGANSLLETLVYLGK